MAEWIARHRAHWQTKPGLRHYYEHEIFAPLFAAVNGADPLLEIGAGPGFLRAYARSRGHVPISTDIEQGTEADIVCDVHALPFANGSFAGAVGVDALHHFARPADALNEVARVLRPGARVALVEPWTGALGWLFYRFVHHEDCFRPDAPFGAAFPPGKSPMDGNAMVPKEVLWDSREVFSDAVPGLRLVGAKPFAGLSYLLTGGFQGWGFPPAVIMALARAEALLPRAAMRHLGLRALFVLEKPGP